MSGIVGIDLGAISLTLNRLSDKLEKEIEAHRKKLDAALDDPNSKASLTSKLAQELQTLINQYNMVLGAHSSIYGAEKAAATAMYNRF